MRNEEPKEPLFGDSSNFSFLSIKDPNEEHDAENEDNRVDLCTVARNRPHPCLEAFTEHGHRMV